MKSHAEIQMNICGRGTGKTTLLGMKNYLRVKFLPKGRGFLSSTTYKQILNSSLPAMENHWYRVGLLEYDWRAKSGHYVIGQKPPAHFEKPHMPPKKYDHIITFYTGLTIDMLSMDRSSPNRGGSYNFGDIDEVSLLKRDAVEKVLFPMVRGGQDIYGKKHAFNGKVSMFGSMPWLSDGQWVLEYEQKAKEDPDFFYAEATPHCNLRALGDNWIEMQQKLLSPEVFDIEIMNKRKMRAESQFYFNFSDERHVYIPTYSYSDDPTGRGVMADAFPSDYSRDQLIDTSWDFGGWFTGMLMFQQTHSSKDSSRVTERMIDSFFVQKGGSAEDVVDQFCDKYKEHKIKYVRVWGEPRGHDPSAFGLTLYQKVQARFMHHGWQCEIKVFQSQAHSHDQRYAYVNEVLAENTIAPRLRCNRDTCKAPIMAIKFAERTYDLKKDKSKEKDRKFDQRLAPHFTDALDYYLMQKHYKQDIGMGMNAWVR